MVVSILLPQQSFGLGRSFYMHSGRMTLPWFRQIPARERWGNVLCEKTDQKPAYSWHCTQEHRCFSQGITFSNVTIVILIVIALVSFSNCNNPGAGSCIYVLLDAF